MVGSHGKTLFRFVRRYRSVFHVAVALFVRSRDVPVVSHQCLVVINFLKTRRLKYLCNTHQYYLTSSLYSLMSSVLPPCEGVFIILIL